MPYVVLAACILRILMHPRYIYLSTCSVKCPLKKEKGSKEGTKGRGLQTNRKQSIMYAHRYVYYICSIYIDMIIGPEYSRYDRDPPVIDTDERARQANPKRYADTPVQKYTLHRRY